MQETSLIPAKPTRSGTVPATGLVTILLVAASDALLLDVEPGINLFAATLAIVLGIAALAWSRGRRRQAGLGVMAALVLAIPLIEAPSVLGLGLAALGLALAALVRVDLLPGRFERMPETLMRFLLPAPATLVRDAGSFRAVGRERLWQRTLLRITAWVVPLGLGLVFLLLFAAANPLLEAALSSLRAETALDLLNPVRLIFWVVMAAGIWALLRPKLLRRGKRSGAAKADRNESVWLGSAAILRSLIVFNALFAVETILDLTFLWGGISLPNGLSHAEYAHRGAYPLIVTALLAGAFVLAAMRQDGPGQNSSLIRKLVYAFIAQNVLLCLSAMLRLQLYVEAYLLTELRLAAGIWMGLVAVGLVLILLRIWWRRSNVWLVATNLTALVVVLYGTALADFPAYIARFNVDHSLEVSGQGIPIDLDYLESLGPAAIPALDSLIVQLEPGWKNRQRALSLRADLVRAFVLPRDWRSWSWRQQRLADYIERARSAYSAQGLQSSTVSPRS